MERGVIDAFEFNNPTSDRRFGAQDVAKNYMLGSYHQASESLRDHLQPRPSSTASSPTCRRSSRYGAEAASTANYGLALHQYSTDLQALINEDGINVKRTPHAILEAQLAAWDEVIPTLEGRTSSSSACSTASAPGPSGSPSTS